MLKPCKGLATLWFMAYSHTAIKNDLILLTLFLSFSHHNHTHLFFQLISSLTDDVHSKFVHKITSFLELTAVWSEIPNEIKIVGEKPVKKIMMIKDAKMCSACIFSKLIPYMLTEKCIEVR